MNITCVIWLEPIVEKLWSKHHVEAVEVDEVFRNGPHFRHVENGHRSGENVYAALGQSNAGRYLTVYFVHKNTGQALILSGRAMTDAERRRYERR